jgi:predicted dehydrogenase
LNTLRLAVIGGGHLGQIHARLLAERGDVDLVGVADPSPEACQQLAQSGFPVCDDYRLLADRIDAAILAAPTKLHHPIGCDLLQRGIHLLIEKPLATSTHQADDLLIIARDRGLVLQAGHVERFNPVLDAAAPLLRHPKYIEAARYSGYTCRSTDIGVVLDLMVHDLDLVLWMVDSPLRSVAAVGISVLGGHEDAAQARLEFDNGCVVNLSASRVSYQSTRQMQVWSARGFAQLDFATRCATLVEPIDMVTCRAIDVEQLSFDEKARLRERLFEEWLPRRTIEASPRNALAEEQGDFLDSIRQRRAPRVSGQHARNVLAVAEQILAQIEEHRWQGPDGAFVGPLATPVPSILRGPHWDRRRVAGPVPHKEAG